MGCWWFMWVNNKYIFNIYARIFVSVAKLVASPLKTVTNMLVRRGDSGDPTVAQLVGSFP
jgi:hypothetical protein